MLLSLPLKKYKRKVKPLDFGLKISIRPDLPPLSAVAVSSGFSMGMFMGIE
jgi:hypothetical protein